MMSWKTLCQMDLNGKRVLTRVDLNVPIVDGKITDATHKKNSSHVKEISRSGTLFYLHMGRPKGKRHPNLSLSQLQEELQNISSPSYFCFRFHWA